MKNEILLAHFPRNFYYILKKRPLSAIIAFMEIRDNLDLICKSLFTFYLDL